MNKMLSIEAIQTLMNVDLARLHVLVDDPHNYQNLSKCKGMTAEGHFVYTVDYRHPRMKNFETQDIHLVLSAATQYTSGSNILEDHAVYVYYTR